MSKDKTLRLCPLCKLLVDEGEAYEAYRRTEYYKRGEYPNWAYYTNVMEHLINFHRLPPAVAKAYIVGYALGNFLEKHSELEAGTILKKEVKNK